MTVKWGSYYVFSAGFTVVSTVGLLACLLPGAQIGIDPVWGDGISSRTMVSRADAGTKFYSRVHIWFFIRKACRQLYVREWLLLVNWENSQKVTRHVPELAGLSSDHG